MIQETKKNPYLDQDKLHALQIMLCVHLDDLLIKLGISLLCNRKMYIGKCPIHCGDNANAINLYRDGDTRPGYWICNTAHCHNTFKSTIIGFIRGILSRDRLGWERGDKNHIISWKETVDFCCEFLKTTIQKIEINKDEIEKIRFSNDVKKINSKPNEVKVGIPKNDVRKWLKIPSEYFVKRGFSPQVLDKYDVGEYPLMGKPMSNRVAVPIYNDNNYAIGFTARSIFDKCDKCKRWHNPIDKCPLENQIASKWYNHNFSRESTLYNYSNSKEKIKQSSTAVIVEGPGCVWRLSEANVQNSVALLGSTLSDQQQILLEMSGAMNLIILTDMDEAGQEAREDIKKRLSRSFRLYFPPLTKHDIGDTSVEELSKELVPYIKKIGGYFG